ncbi:MAG: lipid-binding SYLF domain-containing protein [Synergistaceae bacterium]|nr:lipid-binding SYLF domain-containing protein [Synergistaceae bacterium]
MKKILALACLFVCVFACGAFATESAQQVIAEAVGLVQTAVNAGDAADLGSTLRGSYAVAIVPSMFKGGFVFAGEYGEGLILRREKGKWYGPSFYNISGGSFGLQIGVQSISLLMAVINEKGVRAFMNSRTKLGGDIGIVAGPVGRRAEAATDAQAKASIYSYSMSQGLFAGLSLQGSVVSVSVKRNKEYWGKKIAGDDALKIEAKDEKIQPLLKVLDELIAKAK